MPALLLNASGEPLEIISVERAVVLLLTGRAFPIDSDHERPLRSPSMQMPRPRVVCLTRYIHVPQRHIAVTRRSVLARDGRRCAYCNGVATTIDHVVPRARGGTHSWENVVAACRDCNGAKGDQLLDELGWELPSPPAAPAPYRLLAQAVAHNADLGPWQAATV